MSTHKEPPTLCKAKRKDGSPCANRPIRGAAVCRTHGGAAPQVRAAAQVRLLMHSDPAIAKIVQLMGSKDDRVALAAARDLADRAGLAGTQNIEIGITKRDFSDVTADVVMDLDWDEDDDAPLALVATVEDIVDAEEVEDEDDNERWEREDEQHERAQEIARMRRGSPLPPDPVLSHERAREERRRIREDDDLSAPDKFGARHDTSAEDAALRRAATASRRADKTVRVERSTSTADPYADRFEQAGGRRTMSPKRWEKRKREGGEG